MNEIAKTILLQLGGNRFVVMTGANRFTAGENYLAFKIPTRKINFVKITLTAMDDYTIEFARYSTKKYTFSVVKKVSGIYCDQLQDVFTENTGLYTSL